MHDCIYTDYIQNNSEINVMHHTRGAMHVMLFQENTLITKCPGTAILLCYNSNSLYTSSLQNVIRSWGMKSTLL